MVCAGYNVEGYALHPLGFYSMPSQAGT